MSFFGTTPLSFCFKDYGALVIYPSLFSSMVCKKENIYSWVVVTLWSRYDIIVDVAPEVRWVPENGYKNLTVVVEIDDEIDAQKASEQELKHQHKSLGSLRIVTDRGLQVSVVYHFQACSIYVVSFSLSIFLR